MKEMFCFQCEQKSPKKDEQNGFSGCTVSGICGKKPTVSFAQDNLVVNLIMLANAIKSVCVEKKLANCDQLNDVVDLIVDGLFTTITNVSFDDYAINKLTNRVIDKATKLGITKIVNPYELFYGEHNQVSLRSTLLFGLKGMAAYANHARNLGFRDLEVDEYFIKGMVMLADDHEVNEWVEILREFGMINLKCMALLDEANTKTYGQPVPVEVPLTIEKGPFIVVTGHDLKDLKDLLDQTTGLGINIYTNGEMLPAHGYPLLKKYPHLKGNFGTAWHNQQKEFDGINGPILFTTNCLMPPLESYRDRVFTTSVVNYPGIKNIAEVKGLKDFTPVIEKALVLGGNEKKLDLSGINGGSVVTTGFGRDTVLSNIDAIIEAVNQKALRHIFLVGGCDGAKSGRNYYTDFVKQSPDDTLIVTLACGKYRFNDLAIGHIGPFPRILDMGQCNDAYGAIMLAVALSEKLNCSVNDLPLTLVLSWYEQKAVCILLTLLALGVKNIYIGPSIPAFFSNDVLQLLVENFELRQITTPAADLAAILK